MLDILRKIKRKFINNTLDKTLNPQYQGILFSILRILFQTRRFYRIIYKYRSGDITSIYTIFQKYKPKNIFEKRLKSRIEEMHLILLKGWPEDEIRKSYPVEFNHRIIFVIHNSLPHDGAGYAIRSHNILNHLKQHNINPLAVTRLNYPWDLKQHSDKPWEDNSRVDHITYNRITDNSVSIGGKESEYIQRYGDKLAEIAKKHSAPLIHAASNYLNGLAAARAAHSVNGKSIYEVRGMWHWSRAIKEPYFQDSDSQTYCEIMEKAAVQGVDHIITISQGLKNLLLKWGIPQNKITVVPNAVDTDIFQPIDKDRQLKNHLGLGNRLIIGFIGTLTHYEGLDLLIRASSDLIQEGFRISLLIVGKGIAYDHLMSLSKSLSGKNHIHFRGYVPYQEVHRYYSIIDIFPFPRQNYNVCRIVPPLKIFEVMAMAKPVIVSKLPALEEIIEDGSNGLLSEPDNYKKLKDTLVRLIEDKNLRLQTGLLAREYVCKYHNWSKSAQKYSDIYKNVCASSV